MQDRIAIEVTDDKIFKDLALLFDREDFTNDLKGLRKLIRKETKNYSDKSFYTYLTSLTYFEKVKEILRRYKYPYGFSDALVAAATKKIVRDEDVERCYSIVLMHPESYLDEYKPILTKYDFTFFVPLQSINGNIDKITKEFHSILTSIHLKYPFKLPKGHPFNMRRTKDIRHHREWYWRKKTKETGVSSKISQEYNVEIDTIDKATSRYAERLKADI